jgi:putative endonuclease
MYFLYMIKNSVEKLYVGISTNPERRVRYHNEKRGAQFTRYRSDYKIVFLEEYGSLAEARQREIQIKKWSRAKKEILIERYSNGIPTKLK